MRPHLMIIDDAADQLQLMTLIFKMVNPNLKVVTAPGGDAAITNLRSSNQLPLVILLDLRMPGKDGLEVLKEIKNDPILGNIPVCIFSNGDLPRDVLACYEHGASIYFKKPTGLDLLKKFADNFNEMWFEFALYPHN